MKHISLRTEYSFKKVFGKIEGVIDIGINDGVVGIADINNTFGFSKFERLCKKAKVKPIYGVRLTVIDDIAEKKRPTGPEFIFIAINLKGLAEIYSLVTHAYDNFYYSPRVSSRYYNELSDNVIVIATYSTKLTYERVDYVAVSKHFTNDEFNKGKKLVALSDNYFSNAEDRQIYEIICDGGDSKTTTQHIINDDEFIALYGNYQNAIDNTNEIAKMVEEFNLPIAPIVKYEGSLTIEALCKRGAMRLGVDIKSGIYKDRYDYELKLIKEKEYGDYFLIVADLIEKAKKKMFVGPARGSSAGSLVCYLCGITTIDPIKFDLLFERFIDINRFDLPDIDIDFPDDKRQMVLKELIKTYGEEKVAHIGTISRLKPKSAIGLFAKQLGLPYEDVEELKKSIIERSTGDARAAQCIEDTLNTTEVGRDFVEKYPEILLVGKMENHASHVGIHAAGMIVSNEEIKKYCSINKRETIAMIDKHDADALNLLKIDCLGLRTLTVLAETAKLVGIKHESYYDLPLDDDKVFKLFRDMRLSGIFQFEGYALQSVTRNIDVDKFDDIVAITALARPGPLHSGGTTEYTNRRMGHEKVKYISNDPVYINQTKDTYGVVVFQEQLMGIAREFGGMSWADVSDLRKAASKSLGDDFFNQYKDKFLEGTRKRGIDDPEAISVWENMVTFGSWGFNKCLSEDTMVLMASPGSNIDKFVSIKNLYNMYVSNPKQYVECRMKKGIGPRLVSLFPDGKCYPQHAVTIHKNGPKKCFEYTLEDGSKFECTLDHKFIINGEWNEINSATIGDEVSVGNYGSDTKRGYSSRNKGKKYVKKQEGFQSGKDNPSYINGKTNALNDFIESMDGCLCEDCSGIYGRMEAHHNDFNSGSDRPDDLAWLCPSCHKKRHYSNGRVKQWGKGYKVSTLKITKIKLIGIKETYDIEMPDHHNFLLKGGVITHNSHAVAYSLISYWTAWAKAYHPTEFCVANLNNSKSDSSAIKMLRDMVKNEGMKYIAVDPDNSMVKWAPKDGIILGGLTNIEGIGVKKAQAIIKKRNEGKGFTPSMVAKLIESKTKFDILFPCQKFFGKFYDDYESLGFDQPVNHIENIQGKGNYTFIGKLVKKNLRDANEYQSIVKRGGEIITENTLHLNITLEDDTDSIIALVDRFSYNVIGKDIAENGVVDEDYYLIAGVVRSNWRIVQIKEAFKLNINHKY